MENQLCRLIVGDALTELRKLPTGSLQCCITSPPYWQLRDYEVDGQIGLEATPEEYVMKLCEVFAEVRRVLRDDGTLWLNMGDTYASQVPAIRSNHENGKRRTAISIGSAGKLKEKDLAGIPWRLALALQAQGWYLRSDIIWAKPNALPESVKDRPTKAHEYLFLLSKSKRYYYDADAIREPCQPNSLRKQVAPWKGRRWFGTPDRAEQSLRPDQNCHPLGRNKRTIWTIPIKGYKGQHFATFPEALVEPCVLAGCPKDGLVLDPFAGAGTTLLVARLLGRQAVGIELKQSYAKMAVERLRSEEA